MEILGKRLPCSFVCVRCSGIFLYVDIEEFSISDEIPTVDETKDILLFSPLLQSIEGKIVAFQKLKDEFYESQFEKGVISTVQQSKTKQYTNNVTIHQWLK